jgi:alpha-1,3/alpha-1,6-mannosyltransferase
MADDIAVNSRFTQSMFKDSFPLIKKIPKILYPGINFDNYDQAVDEDDPRVQLLAKIIGDSRIVLSINRFERKKNIRLAIDAFANLKSQRNNITKDCILVITGFMHPFNLRRS